MKEALSKQLNTKALDGMDVVDIVYVFDVLILRHFIVVDVSNSLYIYYI